IAKSLNVRNRRGSRRPGKKQWLQRVTYLLNPIRKDMNRAWGRSLAPGTAVALGGSCSDSWVLPRCLPTPPLPPVTWHETFSGGASLNRVTTNVRKVTCQAWHIPLAGTSGTGAHPRRQARPMQQVPISRLSGNQGGDESAAVRYSKP